MGVLTLLRKVPWWGYVIIVLGVMFAFGKTKVSVGNVTVGGKNLGGIEYDNSKPKSPAK